jgi:hypothetical protein
MMELSRFRAAYPQRTMQGRCNPATGATASPTPGKGFVNPFNPCLPYIDSRTCLRHPSFDSMPAPFDPATPLYLVLN